MTASNQQGPTQPRDREASETRALSQLRQSVEPPMRTIPWKVCSTREQAQEFVSQNPDVSPTGCVYLRCDQATEAPTVSGGLKALVEAEAVELPDRPGVEVMTPSFAAETLKAWPRAQVVGANEDVQASFDVARDHFPPSQDGNQ